MNKRILDGGGLWKSDKVAWIQPEWIRAEYANWIPLALANGVFEADTRRIWATVYSYNRPDISFEDAEEIKREFCRVGLLFLWPDEESGKVWAYFVGIDKPGRLPSRSRLDKKHEPIGPTPPANALRSYVESTRSKPLESALVSQWLANGCLGFGIGIGFGIGKGGEKKNPATKTASPANPRFQPFVAFAHKTFEEKHGVKPCWLGKDFKQLSALLKANASLNGEELERRWRAYLDSTEPFISKQGDSLAYFASHCDTFSNGPISHSKGKSNGRDINDAVAETMRGAFNPGITH
jgi:hypothetical protein